MGAKILRQSLVAKGHNVTHVRLASETAQIQYRLFSDEVESSGQDLPKPDAIFVSTIYTRQWTYLPSLFKQLGVDLWHHNRAKADPLVVFGGQTSYAPEPISPFADLVALGDGEITGNRIACLLDDGMGKEDLCRSLDGADGFYVPWLYAGHDRPMFRRVESDTYAPVLVYPGDNSDSRPTIEVARGCKSKCVFCPIGWAGGTYREADPILVREFVKDAVSRGHNGVNLFAPDYSSVSHVEDLDRYIASLGCSNNGVDARLDRALKHLALGGTVKSFSFGIEGLSARLRQAVGKPLSCETILSTMGNLKDVFSVKWYVIVGLPNETDTDMDEFKSLLSAVCTQRRTRLNVTLTPLQGVPHTPFERLDMAFNAVAVDRALALRAWCRERWEQDRWMILCSGVKGAELHEHDAFLQRSDRHAARYLAAANGSEGYVRSGNWRKCTQSLGVDVGSALRAKRWGDTTPWDFVDVGISKAARESAWLAYLRRANVEDDQAHGIGQMQLISRGYDA